MQIRFTRNDILNLLPHRDPIMLADEAVIYKGSSEGAEAKTMFRVRPDMDIFRGHFPQEPTLPGVYIIEAAAQCADILICRASISGSSGDYYDCAVSAFILAESSMINESGYFWEDIADIKKTAQGVITLCFK